MVVVAVVGVVGSCVVVFLTLTSGVVSVGVLVAGGAWVSWGVAKAAGAGQPQ